MRGLGEDGGQGGGLSIAITNNASSACRFAPHCRFSHLRFSVYREAKVKGKGKKGGKAGKRGKEKDEITVVARPGEMNGEECVYIVDSVGRGSGLR